MTKHKIIKLLICSLIASQCIALTGCRESEEIQNIILTADAEEIDDTEEINPDIEGILDEMAPDLEETSDENADLKNEDAALQQDVSQNNPIMETTYVDNAGTDTQSSDAGAQNDSEIKNGDGLNPGTGEEQSETPSEQQSNTVDNPQENYEDAEPSEEQPQEDDSNGDENSGSDNDSGDEYATLDEDPNSRQVYDENGQTYMPEKVRHVAAVGNAALIAQMLGGEGTLVASSADFLNNNLAQTVFADEGISDAVQLWSNGSDSPMSDSEFETLLSLRPDCCIAISGQTTFSESQIKQLAENKIGYMTVPDCNTAYNIEVAVAFIGDAIGDNTDDGGLNSESLAQEYLQYVTDLKDTVLQKHGYFSYRNLNLYKGYWAREQYDNSVAGKYTALISDWDDNAYFNVTADGVNIISQNGLALFSGADLPVYYYMSLAGVSGNNWFSRGYSGVDDDSVNGENEWFFDGKPEIALTCFSFFAFQEGGKQAGRVSVDWDCPMTNVRSTSLFFVSDNYSVTTGHFLALFGDEDFSTLIVKNAYIKSKIEESKNSAVGLYRIGEYNGYEYGGYEGENPFEYSFKVDGSDLYYCNDRIRGDYDIYVNPGGVGDWINGSVESILESVWISNIYYGGFSDSEVRNMIKEFYKEFYRHDLTDADVSYILSGSEN